MSNSIGQTLANTYQVTRILGDGASGVVSLGHNIHTHELVAIKSAKMADKIYGRAFDHAGCFKTAARMYREIKILRTLQHPNIVTLMDVICPAITEERENIQRMMEMHNHRDVFRRFTHMHMCFEFMTTDLCKLMESPVFFTHTQALSVAHQIISAVEFMHAANVIHRDIKPENILVSVINNGRLVTDSNLVMVNPTTELVVKVADFGLARTIADSDVLLESRKKKVSPVQSPSGSGKPRRWSRSTPVEPVVAMACSDMERINTPSINISCSSSSADHTRTPGEDSAVVTPSGPPTPSAAGGAGGKSKGKMLLETSSEMSTTDDADAPPPPYGAALGGLGPILGPSDTGATPPPLPGPPMDVPLGMPRTDLPQPPMDDGTEMEEDVSSAPAVPMFRAYSDHVLTRWYRAPEVILGERYQSAVDVWAVGCVLVDVLNLIADLVPRCGQRKSLFQGSGHWGKLSPTDRSEFVVDDGVSILSAIFSLIGTPAPEEAARCNTDAQNWIMNFRPRAVSTVRKHFKTAKSGAFDNPTLAGACDLVDSCFKFLPDQRVTLDVAVDHPVFAQLLKAHEQNRMFHTGAPHVPVPTVLDLATEELNETEGNICGAFLDLLYSFDDRRNARETAV